jgi:terminase small subunit-like protein
MTKANSRKRPSPPGGRGRPSEFSDRIADVICLRIADGESLRSICQDKAMPDRSTVFRWLAQKREFRDQYARAREAQADALFDEILEIADNTKGDVIEAKQEDGSTVTRVNHANVHRAKLKVDARKWIAAKLKPKKYGDHHNLLAPGRDEDGNPISPTIILTGRPTDAEMKAVGHDRPRAPDKLRKEY